MAKMGIGNLSTINHIANNYQEQCYLAGSYLAIQIGHTASTIDELSRRFQKGLGTTPEKYRVWAYTPKSGEQAES